MSDAGDMLVTVPLHRVAHARAGDKGNRLNVSVIPYDSGAYALIAQQLTEARVLDAFAHRGATGVRRYDLPLLPAFNFVIEDVLEGGVNGSLNLDGHGKSNSFLLLELPVRVPRRFARFAPGEEDSRERLEPSGLPGFGGRAVGLAPGLMATSRPTPSPVAFEFSQSTAQFPSPAN